ncbi:hypothetical protein MTR_5g413325 [Medicago truncatula]|uniref:OTU domain-containing protein n=1 Tax=Medicago truncatula TaxID=3880 RepID=A0A072UEG2_MEDTR|nr:hypothetical protein MTR_5g413325 [Medicago truncatula]
MNCYFHVQANVKQRCVLDYKYPLGKNDGKEVKSRDVVKMIMRAWKAMVELSIQELYANTLVEFQDSCSDFSLLKNYAMTTLNEVKEKIVRAWTDHVLHLGCRTTNRVESAHALLKKYLDNSFTAIQTTFGQSVSMLEHRFKDVTLYTGLGGHVSRYALDNIALEETRCRETLCMDNDICGCVQRTSYGYHVHAKLLLSSLKRSQFYWMRYTTIDIGYVWAKKAIVERLKKLPFQMKLEVKEGLRQLAFPEITIMSPPPRKVPTKGAKKKVDIARSKGKITSTSRIPSSWEGVDSQNPDSQPSPSPTTSSYKRKKGACLGKTSLNPLPRPTRYPKSKAIPVMRPIDYMSRFILPFIEKVVDVIGDGHCRFRAIAEFMGLTEKNHIMTRTHLIQELKDHKDDYVEVFAGEDRYNYILNGLHPPANTKSCAHLVDKWLTFPDMRHIVANYYKRCVWHNHKKEDAGTWEDEYLDQHELFRKLMAIESGNKPAKPQKESNKAAPILLDTPEKPKQQFEVIAEDEEDSNSLDLPQSLGL